MRVGRAYSFTQVTSDQILGKLTFSIEIGSRLGLREEPGRSRSDLKPMCTVNGEMARSIEARRRLGLRKWFRTMMRPPGLHTRCISRATARIRHDADEIRRIDDVEAVVGERHVGGVHLLQADVPEALAPDALPRLLEHRARQIDAHD